MRFAFTTFLIGTGLLASTISASAQVYGRGSYENGRFSAEFGRNPENRGSGPGILDRVRQDLDHAQSSSYRYGDSPRHYNKVREELGEFQGKLARGKFDRHELDDVIKNLQRVVNDNRMDFRDRDVLVADLYQLRDFRARY